MKKYFQLELSNLNTDKDFETLKKEQEEKARDELRENGLDHLISFTLDNFAYRYLETNSSKDITTQFNGKDLYTVTSYEEDPMCALKISEPNAKKGVIELAKKFSSTKGVGLKIRYQLLCDISGISPNGSGTIICKASINWNMDEGFTSDRERESIKVVSYQFSDPLVLRNKLAVLLEDTCQLF